MNFAQVVSERLGHEGHLVTNETVSIQMFAWDCPGVAHGGRETWGHIQSNRPWNLGESPDFSDFLSKARVAV